MVDSITFTPKNINIFKNQLPSLLYFDSFPFFFKSNLSNPTSTSNWNPLCSLWRERQLRPMSHLPIQSLQMEINPIQILLPNPINPIHPIQQIPLQTKRKEPESLIKTDPTLPELLLLPLPRNPHPTLKVRTRRNRKRKLGKRSLWLAFIAGEVI